LLYFYTKSVYMKKLEHAPVVDTIDYIINVAELDKKEMERIIKSLNNPYIFWDKIRYKKTSLTTSQESLWSIVKAFRSFNSKQISFGNYNFQYNETHNILKSLHDFDMNFGGNLQSQNAMQNEDKQRFLISSIMEEAIASSQIEGAITTRQAAKEMLRKKAKPRNKSEQMIVNNYQTIKHIVEHKDKSLNRETLFEIHKLISYQTLDDANDEGKFRENNEINVVDSMDGEIVHSPPPFKEVVILMEELFTFFNTNNEEDFIHPIIKGCIIHFMIGYIHPFIDGNGRTARALFYWYLLKNGYWLTEYLSISRLIIKSKTQYAMAFIYTETDENDLTYFIDYNIKTMKLAYEELKNYITSKENEKKVFAGLKKLKGVNQRQAEILNQYYHNTDITYTVKEIEGTFGISNQTARTDLQNLTDLGYLEEIELDKKSKAYIKSNKFDKLIK
jgi:Fic family protein